MEDEIKLNIEIEGRDLISMEQYVGPLMFNCRKMIDDEFLNPVIVEYPNRPVHFEDIDKMPLARGCYGDLIVIESTDPEAQFKCIYHDVRYDEVNVNIGVGIFVFPYRLMDMYKDKYYALSHKGKCTVTPYSRRRDVCDLCFIRPIYLKIDNDPEYGEMYYELQGEILYHGIYDPVLNPFKPMLLESYASNREEGSTIDNITFAKTTKESMADMIAKATKSIEEQQVALDLLLSAGIVRSLPPMMGVEF
tara:strand:+ start:4987 stop:5733 length:747 start_codon:yes stop_codon:yes gene_type:complete